MSDEPPDADPALFPAPRLPAHAPLADHEAVAVRCAGCGNAWSVHKDLAGFRVRCACGELIAVAGALAAPGGSKALDHLARGGALDHSLPRREGLFEPPRAPREVPLDAELEPDALADARNDVRQRWTTRTIVELALMMLALVAPPVVVLLATSGERTVVWLPLASLASSVCVIGVGLLAPGYTFGSLARPKPRYLLEAAGAWVAAVLFAVLWTWLLSRRDDGVQENAFDDLGAELGLPMALFVIALCPGIFEELAFRGLLQGRLAALLGRTASIAITGVAFGWAHGMTPAFPIHLGLGLYLCWLRARAGTLVPGMLLHAFYNGTLVLLA